MVSYAETVGVSHGVKNKNKKCKMHDWKRTEY
jgi:hypothetical protein